MGTKKNQIVYRYKIIVATTCCRSEGSKLNSSDEVTRTMWLEEYHVPFARPGSMFRGNPPQVVNGSGYDPTEKLDSTLK